MTKPFTAPQKLRILVAHGALMLYGDGWVPIAQYRFGTMNKAKRYAIAKRIGCAVKCACGCETWALLPDIQFDHDKQHALGGPTVLKNGRPLRTNPCHRDKSAEEQSIVSRCDRVGRKLRVRSKDEVREARLQPRRRMPSAPMRSRPFPQRDEART